MNNTSDLVRAPPHDLFHTVITSVITSVPASIRLCMGSRRGFICRMRMGNTHVDPMTANHTVRIRQRNTLGPTPDGNHYAVVHVTGYIKNWPPANKGVPPASTALQIGLFKHCLITVQARCARKAYLFNI